MYKDACEFKNNYIACKRSKQGTSWKASVQNFEMRILRNASRNTQAIRSKNIKCKPLQEFYVNCRGKKRFVQAFGVQDRSIHKVLNNTSIKPVITNKIIYDNSATIEGRGNDFAIRRLICHLEKHYRRYGKTGGILLIDFSNYFGSIDRDILKQKLTPLLEKDILDIIYYYTSKFSEGLGVGSEVSQISAVYFSTPCDINAKYKLLIEFYHRYMDDSYMLHHDMEYLKYCFESQKQVAAESGTTLNTRRTQIVPLTKPFVFMKKQFYIEDNGHITIRVQPKFYKMHKHKLISQRKALDEHPERFQSILDSNQSWFFFAYKYETHKKILKINYMFYDLFREEIDAYLIDTYNHNIKKYRKFFKNKFMREIVRLSARYSNNQRLRDKLTKLREAPDKYINIYNYTVEEI